MLHIGAYKAWVAGDSLDAYDLSDDFYRKIYNICKHNLYEEEVNEFYDPTYPLTLDQPVIILENAATGSSSENLLLSFDTIGRAKIMGAASYGTTGNPLFVDISFQPPFEFFSKTPRLTAHGRYAILISAPGAHKKENKP